MSMQMDPVFLPMSAATGIAPDEAKVINIDLERPLYVPGDTLGNLASLGMVLGLCSLVAPLVYGATVVVINLYLLTRLNEMTLI